MCESGLGHVGMTQQVVLGAEQLLAAVTADLDEIVVGVGDRAAQIGGRKDVRISRNIDLTASHREVDLHGKRARWRVRVGKAADSKRTDYTNLDLAQDMST
ncbi:hypothetical protein D3C73_751950 [compost metagenome]